MKSFYYPKHNYLRKINHILATDLTYDSVNDAYPDDHYVSQSIVDFAVNFDFCARIVNEWTYKKINQVFGYHDPLAKFDVNGKTYYVMRHKYKNEKVLVDGKLKKQAADDCPMTNIEKLKIPQFIPKTTN